MSNNNSSALPTSSKLSRGIKGTVQRIFVGESNNNQVIVYKYNIITQEWYKEYTISSPDPSILKFGFSLAGTDDASILAVGAPGITEGRVYIYEKDSTGSGWSQRGTTITHPMLNFQGTGSDGFGHSVALSQYDGNILVIGAPFYNEQTPAFATSNDYPVCEGRVFIFKYVGGTGGWAGSAYSFSGTVSSPSGFLNTSFPASWRDFYFGWSLDISDVGNMIIIGCPSIRKLDDIAKNHQETGDLFFDTSVYDEYYNAVEVSELETNWGHTGNAHVYHNHTVLSGGTTWTSNVNVTEVIGVTSIGGITVDTQPEKIRPFEAVGTSVGINRAGNRIFATAPYSYGTSNASPQIFSGRIYTLEWNTVTGTWDEMGRINKHINGGINFRLLGFSADFDGSGNRIVAGAPEWVSINRKLRGQVETFDWNGEAWVSYPTSSVGVDVITDETFYFYQNMRFGDSISVDGEGEMIAIGIGDKNLYYSGSSTNLPRPSQLSVHGITYIGGATTTVAGSDSHILTGSSNIWVYNNPQSMIVSGNMTVSGCMQTSGIAIGSNDDTDTSRKTIFFGGTKADNAYDYTVIENRVYESAEKSELLIFKGDNNADFNGGGIYGPDRIRLKSGQICFDLNTGYDRDGEDIRFTMNKNKLQGGKFGVNTDSPTEAVDVYGKIKSSQGFIGRGEELIGLDLHDSLIRVNNNTGIAGSSYNDLTLGEMSMVSSSTTYPTVNLTSNTNQGYTVLSSFDVTNAWKVFDSSYTGFNTWQLDTGSADGSQGTPLYTRFGPEIGYYFGSTERFPGYPGEWIEIQMASSVPKLLLTEVLINVPGSGSYPLNLHVFGSDNGTDYYHIHTEIKPWSYTASTFTDVSAFTRTPSVNDKPYNKFVLICSRVKVPFDGIYWSNVRLKGSTLSAFTQKLKLDKTGKIGILNTNPSYPLDVNGDINMSTGSSFRINGVAQTFGSGFTGDIADYITHTGDTDTKFGFPDVDKFIVNTAGSERLTIFNNGNTGINQTNPQYKLDVDGDINMSTGSSFRINGVAQTFGGGFTGDIADYITHTGDTDTKFGFPDVDKFIVNTAGSERLTIINNGNTGIKKTNPQFELDVDGDINLTGDLRINGVAQTFGGGGGGGGSSVWGVNTTTNNAYYLAGNIGIGTSSPGYMLDVAGDINMSTGSSFRINGVAQSFANEFWLDNNFAPHIPMTSSTSGGYTILSSSTFGSGIGWENWRAFNHTIGAEGWRSNEDYQSNPNTNTSPYNGSESTTYNGSLTVNGEWIQIYIPSGVITNRIDIAPWTNELDKSPKAGKILGSNDGTTWTLIHSFTNQTYTDLQYTTISFTNTVSYTYIRLVTEEIDAYGYSQSRTGTWYHWKGIYLGEIKIYASNPGIYSVIYTSHKVGINQTSPAYDLDVDGDINLTGDLRINGTAQTFGFTGDIADYITHTGDTDTKFGFPDVDKFIVNTAGSERLTIFNNGNIGINQTNPQYKLDVAGDINMSTGSSFRINGVAQTFGGGSSPWTTSGSDVYRASGKVGIGTNAPQRYLDVDGTVSATDGGILIRNGDSNTGQSNAPQITFGWNGNDQYRHFIQTRHNASTAQNAFDFYVCDGTQNNSLTSGVTHNLTLEAGNVGIGTIYPKARLHVKREGSSGESNVYIQSYSDGTGDRAALFLGTPHVNSSTSQPKCAIIADTVGYSRADLHFCVETTANNGSAYRASTGNSRMMIDGLTGYVGIGRTSPNYILDVNGDINMSTGSSFRINGVAQTIGFNGDIADYITHTGDTNTKFGFPDVDKFIVNTAGSERLTIFNNGNTGINQTNPQYKLDVDGDINLTGDLRINGTAQTIGFTGDIADYITHTGDTNTKFGFPDVDKFIVNTAGSERLTIFNNGNIGINQTNPQYKLDVDGDINMSTGSSFRINGVVQTFFSPWATSGSDIYRASGKVGIGTNAPGAPLDVNGTINATNTNIENNLHVGGVITSPAGGSMEVDTMTVRSLNVKNTTVVAERPPKNISLN